MWRAFLVAAPLFIGLGEPALAQVAPDCTEGTCQVRLTPAQLLAAAEKLVAMRRFDEAKPLIQALAMAPGYTVQTRFLTGFIAAERGDFKRAAAEYEAILAENPNQTRVRLELGRAMLALGKPQSADKQFRLAGQDTDLPPDLAKTIRGVRAIIRQQRAWRLDVDFGLAPDSNINNATAANQVLVNLGGYSLPLTLENSAKARSGTGETASLSAGVRLPTAKNLSMLVDLDSTGTNYSGSRYDDYLVQLAAGPELMLSQKTSASIEAVGAQRWYGGKVVSRQFGAKLGTQTAFSMTDRAGVQIDARHTDALFDHGYDGWQLGLYGTYEHAVSANLVASAGAFTRRDWLTEPAYSSTELGTNFGFGGELRHGITFSLTGSLSHARYDAPMLIFSAERRRDWRANVRATLGDRSIRVLGFSPEASVTYAKTRSTLAFFSTERVRFRIALARYF